MPYDCLRSCELKSSSEKSLEQCIWSCDWRSSSHHSNDQEEMTYSEAKRYKRISAISNA